MKHHCCCRPERKEEDELTREKSKYNNLLIAILFPIVFFSTIVGITFLMWPIQIRETPEGLTPIFIVGIVFTCIAATSGILTISMICYIHLSNFKRKELPFLAINLGSRREETTANFSIQSSSSCYRSSAANASTIRTAKERSIKETDCKERMLPSKAKSDLRGVDNIAATIYKISETDSTAMTGVTVSVGNTSATQLPIQDSIVENVEETHM